MRKLIAIIKDYKTKVILPSYLFLPSHFLYAIAVNFMGSVICKVPSHKSACRIGHHIRHLLDISWCIILMDLSCSATSLPVDKWPQIRLSKIAWGKIGFEWHKVIIKMARWCHGSTRKKCFHFSADDRHRIITIKQIKFKYSRVPIAKYQSHSARRVQISFLHKRALNLRRLPDPSGYLSRYEIA